MKICFIAPANNYHTKKWCSWFVNRGYEVHVISFIDANIDRVTTHFINTGASAQSSDNSKLKYLLHGKEIRKILDHIHPDIINVHYATSYGTAVAWAGVKNYTLSVWGSDVYDFPNKSILHRKMLEFSLKHATHIFSTSSAMAKETSKYTNKHIYITPFGVDMNFFHPNKRNISHDENFVIGNIKALSAKYGIDYLLKAVTLVKNKRPDIPVTVRIAGKGPDEEYLKKLSNDLGISENVCWLGFISQEKVAEEWANMDIGVICSISNSESFGVSAVEAQACGCPVIISDIPGLMEATIPGKTSVVVPRKDEMALFNAIIKLFDDKDKRSEMSREGREYVNENFELNKCFEHINKIFISNLRK